MKSILADYLELCLQFPKERLGKPERKRRHLLLSEWAKRQYAGDPLTIDELYEFWDAYKGYCYNKIFILKAVVPPVHADLASGGMEGLKFLFHCFDGCDRSDYICTASALWIFCEASGFKYKSFELAKLLLDSEPENKNALKYKYYNTQEMLWYSLHEMPAGVLMGNNGARSEDISTMLRSVDQFQLLCKKLNIDNEEDGALIEDCRRFYPAYKEYLQHEEQYIDFEDYLKRNAIPYSRYCSTYYYNS